MQDSVLRYDHADFMKALRLDLGPILGSVGLWSLQCLIDQAKADGNNDLKKKIQVCYDLIEKYDETKFEILGQ